MIRSALPLATLLLLAACAKKPEAAKAGPAEYTPSAEESIDGAKYPAGANSKAFVERLIRVEAKGFKPTDAPGAAFVYASLDFRNDNTWFAQAQMSADGETIDCKEEGTWEMDEALDEHTAPITTKLTRSSCAGRPENETLRLKVKIEKGEYTIVFR
jgi:hypothetical protein